MNNSNFKVVIITRYNEKVDWIDYIIDHVDQIIIYNKGFNDEIFKDYKPPAKVIIKKLPNIGRIDHTIAHYILENWETWANYLLLNSPQKPLHSIFF